MPYVWATKSFICLNGSGFLCWDGYGSLQTAQAQAEDTVDVDLRIIHPRRFHGQVFGYQGTFRAVRHTADTEHKGNPLSHQ